MTVRRTHRPVHWLVVAGVASAALTGCGGDDDTTATSPSVDAPAASGTSPATDPPAASDATAQTADVSGPSEAPGECPDAASVGTVVGSELLLAVEQVQSGAVGLLFCPYDEVVAPGATDDFGTPASGGWVSITFTGQNPVDDTGVDEPVPGVGEQATWIAITDELAVWDGDQGVIVSVSGFGQSLDTKSAAIALAELVL